jgi:hypothetical protein
MPDLPGLVTEIRHVHPSRQGSHGRGAVGAFPCYAVITQEALMQHTVFR